MGLYLTGGGNMQSIVSLLVKEKSTLMRFRPFSGLWSLVRDRITINRGLSWPQSAIHCSLSRSWSPFRRLQSCLPVSKGLFLLNMPSSHLWLFSIIDQILLSFWGIFCRKSQTLYVWVVSICSYSIIRRKFCFPSRTYRSRVSFSEPRHW